MAGHTGIYATSAECIGKAGDNYPSTICIEARINEFCVMAEGVINGACRIVFAVDTTAFAALGATVNGILADAASDLVAIKMLSMKPTGEDGAMNRIEFEDRINILRDSALRAISILRDKKTQAFMGV